MPTIQEQRDKILKLNAKDKKLARLFQYSDLSDSDILFLNYVYEERQSLQFRYAVVYSLIGALVVKHTMFR